jgi:hypothetical protein
MDATGVGEAEETGNTVKSDGMGVAVGRAAGLQSVASNSSFEREVSEEVASERLTSCTTPAGQV